MSLALLDRPVQGRFGVVQTRTDCADRAPCDLGDRFISHVFKKTQDQYFAVLWGESIQGRMNLQCILVVELVTAGRFLD